MTNHMIQVYAGKDEKGMNEGEINTELDDWVDENSEWMEDPDEHHVVISKSTETGLEYFNGIYRFYLEDEKDNLLQKCEDKLENKVPWYRIGYHVCDHDEDDNREDCEWSDTREWTDKDVSISSDIPTFL